jgi:hypothetical protein
VLLPPPPAWEGGSHAVPFPIAPEQESFRMGGWGWGVSSQETDGQLQSTGEPQPHRFLPAHATRVCGCLERAAWSREALCPPQAFAPGPLGGQAMSGTGLGSLSLAGVETQRRQPEGTELGERPPLTLPAFSL